MKPVFCAEVFNEATTATFDVTWSGAGTPFSVSWSVPAGLYWLGAMSSSSNPALGDSFADVLTAADPGTGQYDYNVSALSDNIGVQAYLRVTIPSSIPTITATNDAGQHVLWSLGFRNTTAITLSDTGGGASTRRKATDGIPYGTWWPKAHNTISDRFTPATVAAYTSPLAGSGSAVASVRMEPTTQSRFWRTWRILPVDAARCSLRRAVSAVDPTWATSAGLTSNPQDAALDNPDWWWSRVLDGSYSFLAVEDESTLVSGTPRYGTYRIVYDGDAPINMEAFKGLRSPVLDQWSPAGSRQQLEFCAILVDEGNL